MQHSKFIKTLLTCSLGLTLTGTIQPIFADTLQIGDQVCQTKQNQVAKSNVVMLDVARRRMKKDQIIDCLNQIDPHKFQYVQLHLADNENFSVKLNILHNFDDPDTISMSQLKYIVKYANSKGLMIIPDIDVPSHTQGVIDALKDCNSSWLKQKIIMDDQTLDYTNPNTLNFVKQLYRELLPAFENQTTGRENYFVIGGDEVPGNGANADAFASFMNGLNQYLNKQGFQTIMWNDCLNPNVLKQLDQNITIDYWTSDSDAHTTPQQIADHGNVVKNSDHNASYYNTIDLKNRQLRKEKSHMLAQENNGKMLALWGSDERAERKISNQKVINYIDQVQEQLN